VAPYWNVYDTGSVCLGSMRAPDASTVASIPQWEQSFYESEFTHGNVGRLTRHSGGFEGLWKGLSCKEEFPIDSLIALPETVGEFLSGKRHGHDQ
jgi:PRTRC genetic system protein B